jgi:peptidoglycan/LPS O-acetylase OafA/YrhL
LPAAAAYRPDIDGLRAVAVLAVVLFHADAAVLPGGYVGVDVFFVVSGFLIARLIETECAAGVFSFAGFYERRIRRLIPALAVVFAISTGLALALLSPSQLEHFAGSLLAANFFGANIFFWRTSDYFAVAAEWQPLLHTWSLSVEEQFYLVFPLALVALRRFGRRAVVAALCAVACVSLALAIWGAAHKPAATFYLLPTRTWELLLGALFALAPLPRARSRGGREILALTGLALIAAAAAGVPGPAAAPLAAIVLAAAGTALLVHAGGCGSHSARRLLAAPPLVLIGLASYSLYLWHWPLLVFARHATATRELPPALTAAVVLLAILLALVSWRYVERPFRVRRHATA